jgi:hypothetical protein
MVRQAWRILLGACLTALLAGFVRADDASTGINSLTEQEKKDGWKLLFDGKTADAWRQYRGQTLPDRWQVKDGELILSHKSGTKGGDIVTKDEFGSFELSLEWKISPRANSGIMYRVSEDKGAPYETGPEYQLLDNAGHADGRDPMTSAASCYALYAPSRDVTKPVGQWNVTRIVLNGNHLEHWLNGVKVVQCDIGSADWNDHVSKSKFAGMQKFAKNPKGHIDLQDHGDDIAFRNIKIRPLGGDK